MKKTTFLIMVEGIGSRFSGRIKQLEPVGGHGEIIMDFSIHDAGEAGFRKIIDVTQRKKKSSRQKLGNLIAKIAIPAPVYFAPLSPRKR